MENKENGSKKAAPKKKAAPAPKSASTGTPDPAIKNTPAPGDDDTEKKAAAAQPKGEETPQPEPEDEKTPVKYGKKELRKMADELFTADPTLEFVYGTSDGNLFFPAAAQFAKNHATHIGEELKKIER